MARPSTDYHDPSETERYDPFYMKLCSHHLLEMTTAMHRTGAGNEFSAPISASTHHA